MTQTAEQLHQNSITPELTSSSPDFTLLITVLRALQEETPVLDEKTKRTRRLAIGERMTIHRGGQFDSVPVTLFFNILPATLDKLLTFLEISVQSPPHFTPLEIVSPVVDDQDRIVTHGDKAREAACAIVQVINTAQLSSLRASHRVRDEDGYEVVIHITD